MDNNILENSIFFHALSKEWYLFENNFFNDDKLTIYYNFRQCRENKMEKHERQIPKGNPKMSHQTGHGQKRPVFEVGILRNDAVRERRDNFEIVSREFIVA